MSNEALDMSGNILDLPLLCHHCGRDFKEEYAFGSTSDLELLFCSACCVFSYEDDLLERNIMKLFSAFDHGCTYTPPTLATVGSCGYDLYASCSADVGQGVVTKVRTNTRVSLPPGHVGFIKGRSGLGSRGLTVLGGVIDNDYTGELIVICCSVGGEVFSFKPGDKIAQLVIIPCFTDGRGADVVRGDRGFGSSGH